MVLSEMHVVLATTCTGPLDGYRTSHKAPSNTLPTAGRATARSARPQDPGRDGAGEGPFATGGSASPCTASTNSGSSPAIEAVCGQHAQSMSPPRRVARAICAGRAERRGPLTPFTVMALWRREVSLRAGLRKWGAPLPMLRYRLKRQPQAPGGEKTS